MSDPNYRNVHVKETMPSATIYYEILSFVKFVVYIMFAIGVVVIGFFLLLFLYYFRHV